MKKIKYGFIAVCISLMLAGCGFNGIELKQESFQAEVGDTLELGASDLLNLNEKKLKKASIDLSEVNMSAVGEYTGYVLYKKNKYPFTVVVGDTTAPIAEVIESIVIPVEEVYDLEDILFSVNEFTGNIQLDIRGSDDASMIKLKKLDCSDHFDKTGVDCNNFSFWYEEAGEYMNILKVSDNSGNYNEYSFSVIACTAPVLKGVKDITVNKGTEIDFMAGVTAVDCFEQDITGKITCNADEVDISKPGTYTITYAVTDDREFSTEMAATVTVKEIAKAKSTANSSGSGSTQTSEAVPGEGWVPFSTGSQSTLLRLIAQGDVVYYGGQYWASPAYVNMVSNEVVVYEHDIAQD